MKKFKVNYFKLNIAIIIAIAGSFLFRLYLSDVVVTAGSEFAYYEKSLVGLKKENEYLRNRLLTLNSLNELSARAEDKGFTATTIDYYRGSDLAFR